MGELSQREEGEKEVCTKRALAKINPEGLWVAPHVLTAECFFVH